MNFAGQRFTYYLRAEAEFSRETLDRLHEMQVELSEFLVADAHADVRVQPGPSGMIAVHVLLMDEPSDGTEEQA